MSATPANAIFAAIEASVAMAIEDGSEPLVVFDLDGTLYDNSVRTLRIIQEFAAAHVLEFPDLVGQVAAMRPCDIAYRLADSLAVAGVKDQAVLDRLQAYWGDRFFTDSYVVQDLPVAGSARFVSALYELGAIPVYLTGRDAPNMLLGTIGALQRDGFPVGTVDTRIILKDRFERADLEYKRSVIDHLKRTGQVVGAFDNEPGLCNLFKEAFPGAQVVWLDTSHAPGAPELRSDVTQVYDFMSLIP